MKILRVCGQPSLALANPTARHTFQRDSAAKLTNDLCLDYSGAAGGLSAFGVNKACGMLVAFLQIANSAKKDPDSATRW